MSFKNFMPEVWNASIDRGLAKNCVFVEDTYRRFEGRVRKQGDSVRFLQVARPTIRKLEYDARNGDIEAPEQLQNATLTMPIKQIRYFSYEVGDIDKQQAVKGFLPAVNEETSEGLAEEVDSYISDLAKTKEAVKFAATAQLVTKSSILDAVDEALSKLRKNDVSRNTQVILTGSVDFVKLLKQAYRELDTDNSSLIKHGRVGMYNGIIIKESNNVAMEGGVEYIQLKTRRAIGFAKPLTVSEPFRPEKRFADAVKGFILFDAKILRPREMMVLNVKYTN